MMPLSYQFIDAATRKPVRLFQIDEEVCRDFDDVCRPLQFCQLVTMTGDYVYRSGTFDEAAFLYATDHMTHLRPKIMHYLRGKYVYHCFR